MASILTWYKISWNFSLLPREHLETLAYPSFEFLDLFEDILLTFETSPLILFRETHMRGFDQPFRNILHLRNASEAPKFINRDLSCQVCLN